MITVSEYLHTSYHPDRDYVDGVVLERNWGDRDHSSLQAATLSWLHGRRNEWGIHVYPGLRIRVSATRFRCPDICVVVGPEPDEQILTTPPFICIEILSPEDRLPAMQEKTGDYLKMGVPYVFIINPRTREAWRVTGQGMLAISELRTEYPELVVPLDELFG